MEDLGPDIIDLLLSVPVLFTAVALVLALLSGIVSRILAWFEDLAYRWEARSCLRRSTGDRYGTDVPVELENVR